MHVMLQRTQVTISFNDQTLEAPLKQLAMHLANTVVTVRKSRLQPLHPIGQISLRRSNHQMEMIRHHAMPFKYPTALLAGLKQATFKCLVRTIIHKQILPVIATVDDMIHSIGSFNS